MVGKVEEREKKNKERFSVVYSVERKEIYDMITCVYNEKIIVHVHEGAYGTQIINKREQRWPVCNKKNFFIYTTFYFYILKLLHLSSLLTLNVQ